MEEVSQAEFEKAKEEAEEEEEEKDSVYEIVESDMDGLLAKMENPVNAQKELAVKVKMFLDEKMKIEMAKNGYLSDSTRRWIESYNNILEKLQKSLYGDKSVNLHIHKVTHSQIAAKIREAKEK